MLEPQVARINAGAAGRSRRQQLNQVVDQRMRPPRIGSLRRRPLLIDRVLWDRFPGFIDTMRRYNFSRCIVPRFVSFAPARSQHHLPHIHAMYRQP
jgi:hypothetical protein